MVTKEKQNLEEKYIFSYDATENFEIKIMVWQ